MGNLIKCKTTQAGANGLKAGKIMLKNMVGTMDSSITFVSNPMIKFLAKLTATTKGAP